MDLSWITEIKIRKFLSLHTNLINLIKIVEFALNCMKTTFLMFVIDPVDVPE